MTNITNDFNGITIGQRPGDGYINITDMAKASGKKVSHYLENQSTKEFIDELSNENAGIPAFNAVEVTVGRNGGTWVHPDVAVNFAQWVSPKFAVFVSRLVRSWMMGNVETPAPTRPTIAPSIQSHPDFLKDMVQLINLVNLQDDPLVQSAISQYTCEVFGGGGSSRLLTDDSDEYAGGRLVIVSVRAAELGYSAKEINGGSQLGKFIAKQGFVSEGVTPHGRYKVKTYKLTDELDKAIHNYFS